MVDTTLGERVELLEDSVGVLVTLPRRMESVERGLLNLEDRLVNIEGQVVQLRQEMHGEFSTVRGEVNCGSKRCTIAARTHAASCASSTRKWWIESCA